MTTEDYDLIVEGSAYHDRAIAATALAHYHADEVQAEARRVWCPPHDRLPVPMPFRRVA